jgi:hypothetical protein
VNLKRTFSTYISKTLLTLILLTTFAFLTTACTSIGSAEANPQQNLSNYEQHNQDSTDQATNSENPADSNEAPNSEEAIDEEALNEEEENEEETKPLEKVKVKALYLTGWTVGSQQKRQHYIDLAKNTEINAYVVDVKDDDGLVGYESKVQKVIDNESWQKKYSPEKVLSEFHEAGIHVIGRVVCFKDPVYSSKNPGLAIKNKDGSLYKENGKTTWLDPYNKESWDYLIEISKEAVELGFDEIQFDYVRFPSYGKKSIAYNDGGKDKHEAINEFLAYAKEQMPGVIISADVYGIICESPADSEDIGQYLELVGKDIEYISPMVYPSHYAKGQIVNGVTFAKPDFEPYAVVYNSLVKAKERIATVEDYKADVRPYLQDFTASWLDSGNYMEYGAEAVRQQIKAVYDAGYEEWILWDAMNTYHEDGLLKE